MHALVISVAERRFAFLKEEEMFVCNNSYIDNICNPSNCLKITIGQEDLLFAPVGQRQKLKRITMVTSDICMLSMQQGLSATKVYLISHLN
jgi:hypothetical protein